MIEYRRILVPHDFSEHADLALRHATDLASRLGAELHLVHVVQQPVYSAGVMAPAPVIDLGSVVRDAEDALCRKLDAFASEAGDAKVHVFEGVNVAETLREAAGKLGADLIVMGTHGRTGLAHVFLGSVAERTLRRAPCPVLTVRAASPEDA